MKKKERGINGETKREGRKCAQKKQENDKIAGDKKKKEKKMIKREVERGDEKEEKMDK